MKKLSSSVFLIALIVSAMVIVTDANLSKAQSGTNVSGLLTSDTIWSQVNSPYTLSGPVEINIGTVLTIQPGVTVNIGSYYLQVDGTLRALGDKANPIVITASKNNGYAINFMASSSSWNQQTGEGSIIENSLITGSILGNLNANPVGFLEISGVSPKIDSNNMTFITSTPTSGATSSGITTSGGSPIISNNNITFQGQMMAIQANGPTMIANNTIKGINPNGGDTGIGMNYGTAYGNVISDCTFGIWGSGTIIGNLIYNNSETHGLAGFGITLEGVSSLIENNTIIDNPTGISIGDPSPGSSNFPTQNYNITGNYIFNNQYNFHPYNIASSSPFNANATFNWWGTTSAQAINQTINDFKNNVNYGNVTFVPFLSAPNLQAPICIIANSGSGGSISSIGINKVDYGGNKSFNILANEGYHIDDILVNLTSVGPTDYYAIQNVTGVTVILATFAVNPAPTTTPTVIPTLTPTQTPLPTATPKPSFTPTPTLNPTPTQSPTSTPTLTPSSTPKSTPTPTQTTNSTSTPTPTSGITSKPISSDSILVVSCQSSASYSNFKVSIVGGLTINGAGVFNVPVLLSYSNNEGNSWISLTAASTDNSGNFVAVWFPSASGNYLLNAYWAGNTTFSNANTTINFVVLPYQDQTVFSVSSNSTISAFAFNSTSQALSFSVSGPTGTKGYVDLYIPKSLISDVTSLKVYLDDIPLNYSAESQGDSWLLSFIYHHSTHAVIIDLGKQSSSIIQSRPEELLIIGVAIAGIAIIGVVLMTRKRKISKSRTVG